MSYITDGQKGLEAVAAKDWATALPRLSRAIQQSANPAWLLARAQAYQETGQHADALADAEQAYVSAAERQNAKRRSYMAQAQYRRAVVLGHLKRYADADACCAWSQALLEGKNPRTSEDAVAARVAADGTYLVTEAEARSTASMPVPAGRHQASGAESESEGEGAKREEAQQAVAAAWTRAFVWRSAMLRELAKLPADAPGRKLTVERVPKKRGEAAAAVTTTAAAAAPTAPTTTALSPTASSTWATKKLRVDFYQTTETVNLVLYAKGADKDRVQVDVHEHEIRLDNLPEAALGSTWAVMDLCCAVDTTAPTVRVTPFKIELTLRKKVPGEKWAVWGTQRTGGEPAAVRAETASPATTTTTTAAAATAKTTAATATAPSYPSTGKNWAEVQVEDDEEDKSDVNAFFKNLYANSTPEQQRAMAKSFTESNGTSLSTDWSTVSAGPVATQAPEGVVPKKW